MYSQLSVLLRPFACPFEKDREKDAVNWATVLLVSCLQMEYPKIECLQTEKEDGCDGYQFNTISI